jgi:hypothetical protein
LLGEIAWGEKLDTIRTKPKSENYGQLLTAPKNVFNQMKM